MLNNIVANGTYHRNADADKLLLHAAPTGADAGRWISFANLHVNKTKVI
jgi:hypothetical protein